MSPTKESWEDFVEEHEQIPAVIRGEITQVLERIRAAGAKGLLTYVGVGMYGVVLCDQEGRAWKAARAGEEPTLEHQLFMYEMFDAEYEWLKTAEQSEVADHVARVHRFHGDEIVVERECVFGHPGGWGDEPRLFELHKKIEREMIPLGWTAPEFKGDSYIIQDDGSPKLVDVSFVQRVGINLVRWVEDILDGRRATRDRWHDLAFYVLRETREGTIPNDVSRNLLGRLIERDPEIRTSFIMGSYETQP